MRPPHGVPVDRVRTWPMAVRIATTRARLHQRRYRVQAIHSQGRRRVDWLVHPTDVPGHREETR